MNDKLIDQVAMAISGAPFPSAASRKKAAAAIEAIGGVFCPWFDLKTAPRDGSEIILTDGHTVGSGFYDDALGAARADAGFFWEMDRGHMLTAKNADPVAWQPLPKLADRP